MLEVVSRRDLIRRGMTGAVACTVAHLPISLLAAETPQEETAIPFIDPQPVDPKAGGVKWEELRNWITPTNEFFHVGHYGNPSVDPKEYALRVDGLVEKPVSLSLEEIRSRPKREVTATLECSGNGAGPGFMGAIGNARWAGTALAPLLKECGVAPGAIEAAFWAADKGKEKIRDHEYEQNFARSLSIADATREDVILAYEMNGEPLSAGHGFPLRLIVPGWYGIAWVKWLTRIELRDRRLMNRFMARDYVTVRGEPRGDSVEWKESSVGPLNVKSLVGRVTRGGDGSLRITGAAWGPAPIRSVDLKIDDGPWAQAKLDDSHRQEGAWVFWSYDWKDAKPGEHTLMSRATDAQRRVQPSADDPSIKLKKTYWEANQQYPRKIRI